MLILSAPKGLSEHAELQHDLLWPQRFAHSESGRDQHYVISARSRGGLILWQGNFYDEAEVWRFWHRLETRQLGYQDWVVPTPFYDPSLNDIVGLVYELAVVNTFTASGTYNPISGGALSYLTQGAGGGGGGYNPNINHGGGGAGAVPTVGMTLLTSVAAIAVVIGLMGTGGGAGGDGTGGGTSSLGSIASSVGGPGGRGAGNGGSNGSFSGGAAANQNGGGGAGAVQNGSAGSNSGAVPITDGPYYSNTSAPYYFGQGDGTIWFNASQNNTPNEHNGSTDGNNWTYHLGSIATNPLYSVYRTQPPVTGGTSNGGNGLASSIDGVSKVYGDGGGGGPGGIGGTGTGGTGNGGNASPANRGSGGGGGHTNPAIGGGTGSNGVVIVALTPSVFLFNQSMGGL